MFDAASRLAEGRPAADTVQDYVWACHLLGYQDPNLTLHATQVRDWYGSEDGIDLSALDVDCEALRTAAATAEGVVARQEAQLAAISVAWHGPGAQASRDFLRRHAEASAAVASAVRAAAESLTALRDRLWHSVDGKVAATVAAEAQGTQPGWRAAAQTVTTGAGDRATASELVDQEVKPYVDNDIRSEWLTAMRSAIAAVTEAYDAAAAELSSDIGVAFDVPGDLGPSWSPPPSDGVATASAGASPGGAAPVGAAPMAWPAPPASQPLPPSPAPLSPAPLSPAPPPPAPPVEPAAAVPPSLPSLGGGMPDIGSGLSGFGGQLGDLLGGLLGTSQDALADLPEVEAEPDELDELDEDEASREDEASSEDDAIDEDDPEDKDEAAEAGTESEPATDTTGEPVAEQSPAEPVPAAVASVPPPPTPPPPPIEPLTAPAPDAGTPCEIAADELPQVGE